MKYSKIVLSVFLILILNSVVHAAGGMSGGGGKLIDPTPPDKIVSVRKVKEIIKESAEDCLKKYLVEKRNSLKQGQLNGYEAATMEKLFSHPQNIFKVVDKTHVIIQEDTSCFDHQDEPTDGSFFNQDKKAICISALNISKKVHQKEIKPQSLALMMHEYSEVMGFSDDEAVHLQTTVLQDLKSKPSYDDSGSDDHSEDHADDPYNNKSQTHY